MLSLSSDSSLYNEAKKSGFLADMNAPRSVHLLTAAAKVNWTLSRFCTPLYEAGHSHCFRTACRHALPQSFSARLTANRQPLHLYHSCTMSQRWGNNVAGL
ncbi:MAG: hypothetical protein J5644_06065 [Bacteroidales bacterium]|nr:hypothetical protein [Bacteroidales bacterium]